MSEKKQVEPPKLPIPESIDLNVAEQHGILSLITKRDTANQQMQEATRQLRESQQSILESRGKSPDGDWKLDVSTWKLVKVPPMPEAEMPPVKGKEDEK